MDAVPGNHQMDIRPIKAHQFDDDVIGRILTTVTYLEQQQWDKITDNTVCVSNYRQFNCLFNSLPRLTSKKTSKHRITDPLWGESTGYRWIPHKGPVTRRAFPCYMYDIITCIMHGSVPYIFTRNSEERFGWVRYIDITGKRRHLPNKSHHVLMYNIYYNLKKYAYVFVVFCFVEVTVFIFSRFLWFITVYGLLPELPHWQWHEWYNVSEVTLGEIGKIGQQQTTTIRGVYISTEYIHCACRLAIWRDQRPASLLRSNIVTSLLWQRSFQMKAAIPLANRLATASDRNSNTEPWIWSVLCLIHLSNPIVVLLQKSFGLISQEHWCVLATLQWRHDECDGVSNHQYFDCLLNRLFRRRSKKTSMLCVTGFCEGNSPVTGEFPSQWASNAEYISIWWRHHD